MANTQYLYGWHVVQTLLAHQPERIKSLHLLSGRDEPRQAQLDEAAQSAGIKIQQSGRETLTKLVDTSKHQGVVAQVKPFACLSEDWLGAQNFDNQSIVLALEGLEDPHNLGACIRSAEAFGVQAIVLPRSRSLSIDAVVEKSAAGTCSLVNIVQVANLARALAKLKQQGLWVYGTSLENSVDLSSVPSDGPKVLVMGAEGAGIRPLTLKHCDAAVKIPMRGSVQSLNVSVATGVCLYALSNAV